MFYNQRKTIGVFVQETIKEFQNCLCQGIISEAERLGYNVAIFSGYGKYSENNKHFMGDLALYELPPYEQLAGVILALDTMEEKESRNAILEHVKESCHCPVVSIREIVEGASNFLVDNSACLNDVIAHFVEKHGFTRLCCMTGPKSHWDAVERLRCFENKMAQYGLPVGEHQIFWGDYWTNMGKEACDWFLSGQEMPQAIVCANDLMAFAVTSELIHRGIFVPDDICVSGYDGLNDTLYFVPSMTTVEVPFFEMGQKAVQMIDQKQEAPKEIENVYFETKVIPRESCGCLDSGGRKALRARRNQYEDIKNSRNRNIQFDYFSIHLGDCSTFEQVGKRVNEYCGNMTGLKDYAICVRKDLETLAASEEAFTDTMEMRIGIKDEVYMENVRLSFDKKELLPLQLTGEEPQIWYFSTLHYQDRCYGYEAFRFDSNEKTGLLHFRWNVIIGNKIRDMLIAKKVENLIGQLEYMYDRDALTGLYNRRGWGNHGAPLFEEAKKQGENIFLAVIDLDGMKQINDNFGHAEGDFAICKLAERLDAIEMKDCVKARTGGDEFVFLVKGISEAEGVAKMKQMKQELDDFNRSETKVYHIYASYGYICGVPSKTDTLETYVARSDEEMYQYKLRNKLARGEELR